MAVVVNWQGGGGGGGKRGGGGVNREENEGGGGVKQRGCKQGGKRGIQDKNLKN